jgi:hypothetical protein
MGPHEMTMRRHLADYLDGQLTLAEFTEWIVGAVWDIERYGEPDAARLGYAIELALAEKTSGLLNQSELDSELRTLARSGAGRDDIDVLPPQAPARRRNIA